MKVFLTGASGYLGSAITRELVSHGYDVIGLVRSDTSAAKVKANGGTPIQGDLTDLEFIGREAKTVDAFIHCAFDHSFSDVPKAAKEEADIINTVAAVFEGTDKKLLVCGGLMNGIGIANYNEDSPGVVNPYVPRQPDKLATDWSAKGVNIVCFRLPALYGNGDMQPMSFTTAQIAGHKRAGFAAIVADNVWAAAHVDDVARLFRLVLESKAPGVAVHAVGELFKPSDLAKLTAEHYDLPIKEISPAEAPTHFGFIGSFITADMPFDAKLTTERTGWVPKEEGFMEGLRNGKYWDTAERAV